MSGDESVTYQIEVSPRAERDLKKLHRQNRRAYERVVASIRQLAGDARPHGTKPLSGQPAWRIRIGDYRAIDAISDEELVVAILGVAHRREVLSKAGYRIDAVHRCADPGD